MEDYMFASKNLTAGELNAIVKKLGGEEGARKLLRDELVIFKPISQIIQIDRSKPFDPVNFIVAGWSIEEQDEKSLALTKVDLAKVVFETTLEKNEKNIKGEERLERLKEKNVVRLDAKIFQMLWENQHLIPENWKEKTNGNTTYIFFDGTVLRSSDGRRYVLYLCWDGGEWDGDYGWLGGGFGASDPSVVLAS